MDWVQELNEEQKKYFDKWINSYESKNEFFTWMDEKKVHAKGNPFYGRTWDAHVESCRRSGRDPYD